MLEVSTLEILYELDRRIALIDAGRTPQNEIDATRIRGSCRAAALIMGILGAAVTYGLEALK